MKLFMTLGFLALTTSIAYAETNPAMDKFLEPLVGTHQLQGDPECANIKITMSGAISGYHFFEANFSGGGQFKSSILSGDDASKTLEATDVKLSLVNKSYNSFGILQNTDRIQINKDSNAELESINITSTGGIFSDDRFQTTSIRCSK